MRRSWPAVAGITGGLAAEVWAFDLDQPLLWLPDLGVGVVLILAGPRWRRASAARVC